MDLDLGTLNAHHEPDCHQNLINCYLGHTNPFERFHQHLITASDNLVDRQTDRQWYKHNPFLSEVIIIILQY